MRDDELRALERADLTGDLEERAALLGRLVRAGQVPRDELKLRAWVGDPAAQAAWSGIGELEAPPTLASVLAEFQADQVRRGKGERRLPESYLQRIFGKAWARGVAPLGEVAAVRVGLAAFRCAGLKRPERERPPAWEQAQALAERWLAGTHEEGPSYELEAEFARERGDPAAEVARALLASLGSLTALGAAESVGGGLVWLARLWTCEPGDPELQAQLRRHLPPPSPGARRELRPGDPG